MDKENQNSNKPILKRRDVKLSSSRSIPSIFRRKKKVRLALKKLEDQRLCPHDDHNKLSYSQERNTIVHNLQFTGNVQDPCSAQGLAYKRESCEAPTLAKTATVSTAGKKSTAGTSRQACNQHEHLAYQIHKSHDESFTGEKETTRVQGSCPHESISRGHLRDIDHRSSGLAIPNQRNITDEQCHPDTSNARVLLSVFGQVEGEKLPLLVEEPKPAFLTLDEGSLRTPRG